MNCRFQCISQSWHPLDEQWPVIRVYHAPFSRTEKQAKIDVTACLHNHGSSDWIKPLIPVLSSTTIYQLWHGWTYMMPCNISDLSKDAYTLKSTGGRFNIKLMLLNYMVIDNTSIFFHDYHWTQFNKGRTKRNISACGLWQPMSVFRRFVTMWNRTVDASIMHLQAVKYSWHVPHFQLECVFRSDMLIRSI